MANDFAGVIMKPGDNTDIVKTVDTTPAPKSPEPPKPPEGWDKTSYSHVRQARKQE